MLKREVKQALEEAEFEMNLNLENNYKDQAHQDFLTYVALTKRFYDEGKIKEKDYEKLKDKFSDLAEMFEEYHH